MVNGRLSEIAAVTHTKCSHRSKETSDMEEFLNVQALDNECQAAARAVRFSASLYTTARVGYLVRQASVDDASHRYILVARHASMLYVIQYSMSAGHMRERHLYDTRRHIFF